MSPRPAKSLADRRAAFLSAHPRLARQEKAAQPINLITLGIDERAEALRIEDKVRLEHMHVIGATGCGKSTALLNMILQDIARGRGVCVLDPHGSHPDSLLNMVLRFLQDHRWFAAQNVHIIAPNIRDYIVGFNPLAPLPGTDPAVIAGAMVEAFARVWSDEDSHRTPLTRRILRNIFIALSESGLPLADAAQLLDYEDAHGLRRQLIETLQNANTRQELERIERLARQPRGLSEFETMVLGPTNRLAEFLACDALRLMFSMTKKGEPPARTLNLLDIMNRGHSVFLDLQHGPGVDEAGTDLLGRIFLRYLFLLMKFRRPYYSPGSSEKTFHPFFVYVDEAHRYVTEDVEGLLTQARKFGIGVTLAHQYLAQLGKPREKIYEAVCNSTATKMVFRVKSPEEAQTLAHDVLPLSLEIPVKASIRPTQTGYTIGKLSSETYSVHEGEGETEGMHTTEALSEGRSVMEHWVDARSTSASRSLGTGSATSTGAGFSEAAGSSFSSMESTNLSYDPNTQTFIAAPMPLGMTLGSADARSQSLMSSRNVLNSESLSRFQGSSEGASESHAQGAGIATHAMRTRSQGTSLSKNRTHGTSRGSSSSEAALPTYDKLPTSFHSKDNELYIKGEMIRNLPTGYAIIKSGALMRFIKVPPARKKA